MYNELYEVWKQELENPRLVEVNRDFYSRLADYLRKLKEESRMLDKRTVKARLLDEETRNVKRMVLELVRTRYRKLVWQAAKGKKISPNFLTVEEEKIYSNISHLSEVPKSLVNAILRGYTPNIDVDVERKRTVLRFLKDIPAIVGTDMKAYGSFKLEDVASLPLENANILIKQGLAEKVEINKS
jgi:DNA replication initiation complex subunit (GINS family)